VTGAQTVTVCECDGIDRFSTCSVKRLSVLAYIGASGIRRGYVSRVLVHGDQKRQYVLLYDRSIETAVSHK